MELIYDRSSFDGILMLDDQFIIYLFWKACSLRGNRRHDLLGFSKGGNKSTSCRAALESCLCDLESVSELKALRNLA